MDRSEMFALAGGVCFDEVAISLLWSHNEHDGISNRWRLDCLHNCCSGADQRKHQSSTALGFVRGIHQWPVNSPHKGPVKRKMFQFDDEIMHYKVWILKFRDYSEWVVSRLSTILEKYASSWGWMGYFHLPFITNLQFIAVSVLIHNSQCVKRRSLVLVW